MTPTLLQQRLHYSTWVEYQGRMSTVLEGFGFIIYRERGQMWLAAYSKKETAARQEMHNHTDTLILVGHANIPIHCMFVIPASEQLVEAAYLSINPELSQYLTKWDMHT